MAFSLVNLKNSWAKFYSNPEFYELNKKGYIKDFRLGGIIFGPSHLWGGINCYTCSDSLFELVANIEGGEFIVNSGAAQIYSNRLEEINTDFSGSIPKLVLDKKEIITNNRSQALWLDGNSPFIVNARSTAKHYEELLYINSLEGTKYQVKLSYSQEWTFLENLDSQDRFYTVMKRSPGNFIREIRKRRYDSALLD